MLCHILSYLITTGTIFFEFFIDKQLSPHYIPGSFFVDNLNGINIAVIWQSFFLLSSAKRG
jgi:hypothetical protein